ncbi:putative adenylate-forming enzyme [Ensifer adhaerens]|uniref:Adenylate-forming enzyme n=1 Tax=Ensifer adhaerens TaxID=106592 RepID=A0ACC5SYK8_ENSAD|nr:phenylacetate--CoA ligase family protein [Ensifer adhaerens]MBP1873981.1 putative adenylate-forming enzyme [Ensifer adhaerens]
MSPSPSIATLDTRALRQHSEALFSRCQWSREQLLSFQATQLQSMLQHAIHSSPYYRDTIGALVAREAALAAFPVLNKHALMENFDRIVTDTRLDRHQVERHLDGDDPGSLLLGEFSVAATGGTTGERGITAFDGAAWLAAIATMVRFQRIIGIEETTRSMAVFASSPVHISHRIGAELRAIRPKAPGLNVLMPTETIVETLNAYQPEVISTYPSFVRVLAAEQEAGRLRIRPRLFRTSAETLTQDVRAIAAETWQATVANSYVCTEAGPMGHECLRADGLHLAEDAFVFEVVDTDNRPVANGTQGAKLLVTTLTNRTLPLVRYEISDMVTMASEPCPCGLPFWRIASIAGRREEMLRFAKRGGGTIDVHAHRLRSPLTGTAGVRQFQFVPLPDGLEIRISVFPGIVADAVSRKIEDAIRATLDAVDAQPSILAVKVVDAIDRSGAGAKVRLVATAAARSPDKR